MVMVAMVAMAVMVIMMVAIVNNDINDCVGDNGSCDMAMVVVLVTMMQWCVKRE